ncbi:transmembrane protein 272-like [Ylistrum balloti]|uniref:transmembrane protein 272-like n=1 Tax=Ylistrum balloti TaxID=509963 RepID=UPI002905C588|nr:transmembrane protein 272-like [Ylistrum balloti]
MTDFEQTTPVATDTLLPGGRDVDAESGHVESSMHTSDKSRNTSLCTIVIGAYEESEDLMTFISQVFSAIDHTAFGYTVSACSFIIGLLAIVLGILRYGACPCEPCVPMFLAVGGCALMLRAICKILSWCCNRRKTCDETEPDVLQTLHSILGILVLFWTIPGIVWIFGIIHKVDTGHAESDNYCDYVLYWFTVSFLGIIFFVLLLQSSLLIAMCIVHNYMYTHADYSNFDNDDNETDGTIEDHQLSSEGTV